MATQFEKNVSIYWLRIVWELILKFTASYLTDSVVVNSHLSYANQVATIDLYTEHVTQEFVRSLRNIAVCSVIIALSHARISDWLLFLAIRFCIYLISEFESFCEHTDNAALCRTGWVSILCICNHQLNARIKVKRETVADHVIYYNATLQWNHLSARRHSPTAISYHIVLYSGEKIGTILSGFRIRHPQRSFYHVNQCQWFIRLAFMHN